MLVTAFRLEADQIIIAVSDVLRLNTALLTPSEKGVLFHSQEMNRKLLSSTAKTFLCALMVFWLPGGH